MSLAIRRIGSNLGAEASGIDVGESPDDATVAALEAALAKHEVLVFRDQQISAEQLIAFAGAFGELTVHPFAPQGDEAPVLIRLANAADNPPALTDVWHSDETFRAAPPMATMLCAKVVPELGGDTVFASMSAAHDALSDRMQRFISGLQAVHDFKPFKNLFDESPAARERLRHFERLYPPATHPVVRLHPVSGRKVLFVNPQFTIAIKDMDERESRALLDTLFHQALIPEVQYRHRWRSDTIAFWDNRSVQHYAVHDYFPATRIMERVTIRGDRPVGAAAAEPEAVRRHKFGGAEAIAADTARRPIDRAREG